MRESFEKNPEENSAREPGDKSSTGASDNAEKIPSGGESSSDSQLANWQTLGDEDGQLSMAQSALKNRRQRASAMGRKDLEASKIGAEAVKCLMTLVKRTRMYEQEDHGQIVKALETLQNAVKDAISFSQDKTFEFQVRSHGFEVRSIPLYELNKRATEFHQRLWDHGIGRVVIKGRVKNQELLAIAQLVLEDPGGIKKQPGQNRRLLPEDAFRYFSEKLTGYKVGNIQVYEQIKEAVSQEKADLMSQMGKRLFADCENPGAERYHCLLQWAYDLQTAIYHERPVDHRKLLPLCRDIIQQLREDPQSLIPYALMRGVAPPEITVPVNSALLAVSALAPLVESDSELLEWLRASFFVDTGTYVNVRRVPLEQDYLDQEQWHPLVSSSVLDSMPRLSRLAMVVAFEHHLGEGQQGFPIQPFRWPRNVYSSVLDIAVRYTELTTYRRLPSGKVPEVLTHDQALNHLKSMSIKEEGEQQRVVDIVALNSVIHTLGELPAGLLVALNNGALGLLLPERFERRDLDSDRYGSDRSLQSDCAVLVLSDEDGCRIAEPYPVRLGERMIGGALEVKRILDSNCFPGQIINMIDQDWGVSPIQRKGSLTRMTNSMADQSTIDSDETIGSSSQLGQTRFKKRDQGGNSLLGDIEI